MPRQGPSRPVLSSNAESVEQYLVRHAETELRNLRRPERWLWDYYTLAAIDRLRAERRGLSVKAAADYVASVLIAGPWAPDRITDVFDILFPSTDRADLPRCLAENIRNAYQQRRQR